MAELEAAQTAEAQVGISDSGSLLKGLLKKDAKSGEGILPAEMGPMSKAESDRLEAGVVTFIDYLVHNDPNLVSKDAIRTIDKIIELLDGKLSKQINLIMHSPAFQAVEGTWRGLNYLVARTITNPQMKIKVMDLSKDELSDMMESYEEASFDQSPLFKRVYEEGIGAANAEIFGAITGDYHFSHSPRDVMTLKGVAKIAAASHCPFLSGADPAVFNMKSWTEINDPPRLANIQDNDFYAPWRSLRKSEDARYLGLAMPRFVARYPYGAKTKPVKEFNFEEDTASGDHSRYTWCNSAYAMAAGVTRAFTFDGFCARIRGHNSGGMIGGLPAHTFASDDQGVQTKCPTEINIPQRREKELADLGFMPLIHFEGTDYAVFIGAQSLQEPKEYEGADGKMASSNANLSARLPYLFVSCRFAHYLKRMVYKSIGMYTSRNELQQYLQNWINNYVEARPDATAEARAQRPLAAARVTVAEDESNPGYYGANFKLAPHIQLEGISVMLNLVAKLPAGKG